MRNKKERKRRYWQEYEHGSSGSGVSASLSSDIEAVKQKQVELGKVKQKQKEKEDSVDVTCEWNVAVLDRGGKEEKYGWFGFRPRALQFMCHPTALLISLASVAFAQGFFVHGTMGSIHSDLHKTFRFSWLELGAIRMTYDAGIVSSTFVLLMYHSGHRVDRPRWLGISCLLMAFGALICSVSHFHSKQPFCYFMHEKGTGSECNSKNMVGGGDGRYSGDGDLEAHCRVHATFGRYRYIFMLGLFLAGVGSAPFYTMGITYLDESVSHRTSILYTGAIGVMLLVGIALGFIVNRFIREMWVDVNKGTGADQGLISDHQLWVGAWWIGPIVSAALLALIALPIFGFPKQMPGVVRARIRGAVERGRRPDADSKDASSHTVWQSLKACLVNITYLCLVVEQCAYLITVTSFIAFLPSYLSASYGFLQSEANLGAGLAVVGALLGSIFGTWLQRRFNFSVIKNLRFSFVTALITLIFLSTQLIGCYDEQMAGVTKSYPVEGERNRTSFSLNASCNSGCRCSLADHNPVCYVGPEPWSGKKKLATIIYFSPCFAGCKKHLSECSCVPKGREKGENSEWNGHGEVDWTGGGKLLPYSECSFICRNRGRAAVIGLAWSAALIFARVNPVQQCFLRCISSKDRVVGLTLNAFVSRLLAALAPVLMGLQLHHSCVAWRMECGKTDQGICAWMDHNFLSRTIGIVTLGAMAMGAIALCLAMLTYPYKQKIPPSTPEAGQRTAVLAPAIKPHRVPRRSQEHREPEASKRRRK